MESLGLQRPVAPQACQRLATGSKFRTSHIHFRNPCLEFVDYGFSSFGCRHSLAVDVRRLGMHVVRNVSDSRKKLFGCRDFQSFVSKKRGKFACRGLSNVRVVYAHDSWKSWLPQERKWDGNPKQTGDFTELGMNSVRKWGMEQGRSDIGISSIISDGFFKANSRVLETNTAEALAGSAKKVSNLHERLDEEDDDSVISSSLCGQSKVSKAQQILVFLGRACLILGVGLRFSTPALARPVAPQATVTSIGNTQSTQMQEDKAASKSEDEEANVDSELAEESQEATSETAEQTEGLSDLFWNGIDTPDGSSLQNLKLHLKGHPNDVRALGVLLHAVMEKRDMLRALTILEMLEKLQPHELEWKFMKARAHECTGELMMAKEGFEELLRLRPLSARALQGMVMILDQVGEETAALEMIETALTRAIEENKVVEARNLRMLLGQFHTLKGNFEEALKQYNMMIDQDPNDFRPYLCQGLVYSVLGEKEKAEQQLRKYRQLCPKDFPNRSYLDDLMLKAKNESRKMHGMAQKANKNSGKGQKKQKPMKQPSVAGIDSSRHGGSAD